MNFSESQIVWARRNTNDIYWPGKVICISTNTNHAWFSHPAPYGSIQPTYLVQFFVTNQSIWTDDLLAFGQYRDSMANESFVQYGLYPAIKQDFLNAVHQADYAGHQDRFEHDSRMDVNPVLSLALNPDGSLLSMMGTKTDNDFLSTPMLTSNTGPVTSSLSPRPTSMLPPLDLSSNSNSSLGMLASNDDWYSQQGLLVESITPPLPTQNDQSFVFMSPTEQVQQTNAVIIVTRRAYIYPSFLTYLLHSLHHFTHRSIFYIDDSLNTTPLPPTSTNITYLICLDQFHPSIQQMLDTTVLHNLNAPINYCFLLLNAPSQRLISHVYETVMDKRLVLVLHYHSTFDDAPLLLCSGARETFEMVRGSVLQCLCVKVKYIDAPASNDEQMYTSYCISSITQSSNVLHQFVQQQIQQTVRQHFGQDLLTHHSDVIDELFPSTSGMKTSRGNTLLEFIQHERQEMLENPSKQVQRMNELFENAMTKTHASPPICEYYLKHVLDKHQ